MPRPLDTRLGRVEGRRRAATAEHGAGSVRGRRRLRAEAAIGEVIREALAHAGIDPTNAARLCLADDAAAALAAIPDTPALRHADANDTPPASPHGRARAHAFAPKILAMSKRFAGGPPPDFANASLAELFAWSLANRTPK
jgi:hypothetical protein